MEQIEALVRLTEAQEGLRYLEGVKQNRPLDDYELSLQRLYQGRIAHYTPRTKKAERFNLRKYRTHGVECGDDRRLWA